ncbi:hypothetical protein ONZ45_g17849 [Pleurotus djamor]|nr:hypothetical protein ONZ45_g17849 [Pleurotus djamor]
MAIVTPKVWLITGASSGIGKSLTEVLLSKGEIVVATARNPTVPALSSLQQTYPPTRFLPLKCDVTIPNHIKGAFEAALKEYGRIDVVVNNAGVALIAEVEGDEQIETARKMFDVNFWGATKVSTEAVKVFREANPHGVGGRLIIISSGTGIMGVPASGFYSASKHALEGVSKTLAAELDPRWNIKITLVELGSFHTRIIDQEGGMPIFPRHPAYGDELASYQLVRKPISEGIFAGGDPNKAGERIHELGRLAEPPLHLPLGKESKLGMEAEVKKLSGILEEFGSWSEGLEAEI